VNQPSAAILAAFEDIVGPAHVITDPDIKASYETDWTGRFSGRAAAVLRPANTEQVAEIITICAEHRIPVIPQGGNTGLVGGAVPVDGSVLLSLTRLDSIGAVDQVSAQVAVGAGATLTAVQQAVRPLGLDVGVDLASRDSATIGGLLATNAGGEHVLRYGTMRRQVVGIEAVMADGAVLTHMTGLVKDNSGYDLVRLISGSEGTLAVITKVLLQLVPMPARRTVALIGVATLATAQSVLKELRLRVPQLAAAEVLLDSGLVMVRAYCGLPRPLSEDQPVYLLVEAADATDPTEALVYQLEKDKRIRDAVIANDQRGMANLWRYREEHSAAVNALGTPIKLDVALPAAALPAFVGALPHVIGKIAPEAHTYIWGHLAEANLHVNIVNGTEQAELLTDAVLDIVIRSGGSISAEHGVGRAKAAWLDRARSETEYAAMKAIKNALDPSGILNPGVIFPGEKI
jgi:FAD/FMN-containing dehydrogenase